MSDFDEILERLVTDPDFQAALAADPQTALAGYQLADHERELLATQLVAGDGEQRTVETRTSKSGMLGLVGPVAAAFGVAATGAGSTERMGVNPLRAAQSLGSVPDGESSFGSAARPALESFGSDADPGVGALAPHEALGQAGPEQTLGRAPIEAAAESAGDAPLPATDYRTRVDVDGDGRWDPHTAYERGDGGVDIVVDRDHDGRAEFVGHDVDRDGLVDVAEFDNDGDGVLETRMYDDTGDGWMDRAESTRTPEEPTN